MFSMTDPVPTSFAVSVDPCRPGGWRARFVAAFMAAAVGLTAVPAWAAPVAGDAGAPDRYLEGYARALLDHALPAGAPCAARARAGVLVLRCPRGAATPDVAALERLLAGTPGFVALRLDDATAPPAPGADAQADAGDAAPAGRWFPTRTLFEPLLADPREPRFFVSARHYDTDVARGWFTEVGYGEDFPIYQRGDWQVGISGGLFGLFDLESESFDLINADYTVGMPLTWRRGASSARVRLYHQSSHLGDEFLLRGRADRVNLSFEALDVLLARDLGPWRVYGGGEALVHREPADLDRLMVHAGAEYLAEPRDFLGRGLYGRPVAGVDVKSRQEHGWSADVSLKAGWQFEAGGSGRLVRLLLEAFRGHSPHGQFYADRIDYLGLGVVFGL